MIWVENKFLKEPGARSCFRLESCSFLSFTKGMDTGPNSRKSLPVPILSRDCPPPSSHLEPRISHKFPSKFFKKVYFSLSVLFCVCVRERECVGGEKGILI